MVVMKKAPSAPFCLPGDFVCPSIRRFLSATIAPSPSRTPGARFEPEERRASILSNVRTSRAQRTTASRQRHTALSLLQRSRFTTSLKGVSRSRWGRCGRHGGRGAADRTALPRLRAPGGREAGGCRFHRAGQQCCSCAHRAGSACGPAGGQKTTLAKAPNRQRLPADRDATCLPAYPSRAISPALRSCGPHQDRCRPTSGHSDRFSDACRRR